VSSNIERLKTRSLDDIPNDALAVDFKRTSEESGTVKVDNTNTTTDDKFYEDGHTTRVMGTVVSLAKTAFDHLLGGDFDLWLSSLPQAHTSSGDEVRADSSQLGIFLTND
jgi:hypothetical protein